MFCNCWSLPAKTELLGKGNRWTKRAEQELKSRSCLREEAETQTCCCGIPWAAAGPTPGRAGGLPQAGSQLWLGAGGPHAANWLRLRERRAQHWYAYLMDTHPTNTHRGENKGTAGTVQAAASALCNSGSRHPVKSTLCSEVAEAAVGCRALWASVSQPARHLP